MKSEVRKPKAEESPNGDVRRADLRQAHPNFAICACMASGVGVIRKLDLCCPGPFHAQEDRLGLDRVTLAFHFTAARKRWLTNVVARPDVGLLVDAGKSDADIARKWRPGTIEIGKIKLSSTATGFTLGSDCSARPIA